MEVKLNGITPFTESVFNNCTYPIRFAVLCYYGRPIIPLVLNEEYRYDSELCQGRSLLAAKTFFVRDMDSVVSELGIVQFKRSPSTNVVAELQEALTAGYPVMIMVDRYYQSLVPKYYLQEHFLHAILVYGFDDVSQTFFVFDDLCQQQNAAIVPCSMTYKEIAQSHTSCYQVWGDALENTAPFVAYSSSNGPVDEELAEFRSRQSFLAHMLEHRQTIEDSLRNLSRFAELLETEAARGDRFETLRILYHTFCRIGEIKSTQRYQHQMLYKADLGQASTPETDALVQAWNVLRVRTIRVLANPTAAAFSAYLSDVSSKIGSIVRLERAQQSAFFEAYERSAGTAGVCSNA